MPKNAVADWDTTAGNNADVGGINIAEGMSPGNVNNAMREIMAQIASWRSLVGQLADNETVTGSWTFDRTTSATNTATDVLAIVSQSSGVPANGIGAGIAFGAETTAGNVETGAAIRALATDVTSTSEDFALALYTMAAGAAPAERFRVDSTGAVLPGLLNAGRVQWTTPVAAVGASEAITDCDAIVSSGLYYIAADATNRPPLPAGQGAFMLHLRQYADDYWCQFAIGDSLNTGIVYMRNRQSGSPGAWRSWLGYQQAFVATASGTQQEYTTIPDGVTRFRVIPDRLALNASGADVVVQLRTSPGGVVTSGYTARTTRVGDAIATTGSTATGGLSFPVGASATVAGGEIEFFRLGSGAEWGFRGQLDSSANNRSMLCSGVLAGLTNPVAGVRLTATTGAFAGGGFYVEWGG